MMADKNTDTGNRSEEESLKEREYRDAQGNIHHHTKTYEEQHGGDSKDSGRKGGGSRSYDGGSRESESSHEKHVRAGEQSHKNS